MVVRNPKFVNAHVLFDRASGRDNINTMQSRTGATTAPRFSGWVEQELGVTARNDRVGTVLSRGGSIQNQMRPKFRMKRSNLFTSPDDFADVTTAGNPLHQQIAMLAILKRNKFKKPFILKKSSKFKHGLYKFKQNKIVKLQDFDSDKQVRKRPWLIPAREKFLRDMDLRKLWATELNRQLKRK